MTVFFEHQCHGLWLLNCNVNLVSQSAVNMQTSLLTEVKNLYHVISKFISSILKTALLNTFSIKFDPMEFLIHYQIYRTHHDCSQEFKPKCMDWSIFCNNNIIMFFWHVVLFVHWTTDDVKVNL